MDMICEKHGEYQSESLNLFGHFLQTGCPKCEEEKEELEARKAELEKEEQKKAALIARGIEPEFFGATLENYKAENKTEQEALQAVKDLHDGKIQKVLLLGGNGVGKTHLASAMALLEDGVVITMFEISARIRQGFNLGMSELTVLNQLLSYKFIAIDELGRTKGSDTEHNWLSYLIDKAHARGIKLMLISNRHTAKQLSVERRGEAIENYFDNDVISRLRQNTKVVEVTGRDRRAA